MGRSKMSMGPKGRNRGSKAGQSPVHRTAVPASPKPRDLAAEDRVNQYRQGMAALGRAKIYTQGSEHSQDDSVRRRAAERRDYEQRMGVAKAHDAMQAIKRTVEAGRAARDRAEVDAAGLRARRDALMKQRARRR